MWEDLTNWSKEEEFGHHIHETQEFIVQVYKKLVSKTKQNIKSKQDAFQTILHERKQDIKERVNSMRSQIGGNFFIKKKNTILTYSCVKHTRTISKLSKNAEKD